MSHINKPSSKSQYGFAIGAGVNVLDLGNDAYRLYVNWKGQWVINNYYYEYQYISGGYSENKSGGYYNIIEISNLIRCYKDKNGKCLINLNVGHIFDVGTTYGIGFVCLF